TRHAAVAGAEGATASTRLVHRISGSGHAPCRDAQRRCEGGSSRRRLCIGDDDATCRGIGDAAAGASLGQSLLSASSSEDLRLAAWFLWMTPLLAALSSWRLADFANAAALSLSPLSAASRNARIAV